jgi:hypothetical protein
VPFARPQKHRSSRYSALGSNPRSGRPSATPGPRRRNDRSGATQSAHGRRRSVTPISLTPPNPPLATPTIAALPGTWSGFGGNAGRAHPAASASGGTAARAGAGEWGRRDEGGRASKGERKSCTGQGFQALRGQKQLFLMRRLLATCPRCPACLD